MIAASGRFDIAFTCTDSTGAPVAPTGTPTGVLVKNGTDLGTTVTVTMSTAQGVASCTIPSDAANGDRFYIRVSAVISGTTYVLSGPVETVSNSVAQTGDSYARIGAAGAGLTSLGDTRLENLDAAVSSRLSTVGYTAPPSAATNATAVRSELTTELGRIDAAISSRLSTVGYTTPLDATGVRTAVGLASANLDTQLAAIHNDADATNAVVQQFVDVDGDVEPTIRAWLGLATANLDTQLAAIDDYLDTEVAVIIAKLGTPAGASVSADIAAVKTDTGNLVTRITANLFSGITYLKNWLGTLAGKTADATTLAEINATTAGATYANTTDSLEAIRDNAGSGGITQGDVDDIVAGVSESLTAPGFAASIAIQEGTYATVADVEARLTAYGVTLAADVEEYDGTRGSDELQMIEVAIEYSNSLIDEYIVDLVHPTSHRATATFTRPSGNAWLRDRCVDIACYRLATLGGRTASDVLAGDYASAVDRLSKAREQMIRIPNLIYTSPTRPYATEYGGGIGIVRRAGT